MAPPKSTTISRAAIEQELEQTRLLNRTITIRAAQKNFWDYCKVIKPKFYKDDRLYLKKICDTLQALYENKLLNPHGLPYKRVMINAPPSFGKSYTVVLFCSWCFGKDIENEVMSVSYNSKLSTKFATAVRDTIEEQRTKSDISYFDIFPATRIKKGDASKGDWALEGSHHSYLATSFDASMAGYRSNCFPKGTMITTNNGKVDISCLTKDSNHSCLSYNHKYDILSYKPIIANKRSITHELIKFTTESGRQFICTPDHKIWNGTEYIEAYRLQKGNNLARVNMRSLQQDIHINNQEIQREYLLEDTISSIEWIEETCYVYDIEVEDNHNFFANDILVHNCGIIDDPIKGPEVANNIQELEDQWVWYTDSFLQRLQEGAIQIVIQTRWALKDLCGRLLDCEPELWYVLKLEAMNEITKEMLCPEIMSRESYDHKLGRTSTPIFRANYHQETMDVTGRLIEQYTTYGGPNSVYQLPQEFDKIYAQIDTADAGADATVCIVYGMKEKLAYIIDIYHSTAPMHITESKVAAILHENCVAEVDTEGNNGGEGYSRQVKRLIRLNHNNYQCKFNTFHQRKNKIQKILSNATIIQEDIIFPFNWSTLWPAAYHEVIVYQRHKKNVHDCVLDALSEIAIRITGNLQGARIKQKSRGRRTLNDLL